MHSWKAQWIQNDTERQPVCKMILDDFGGCGHQTWTTQPWKRFRWEDSLHPSWHRHRGGLASCLWWLVPSHCGPTLIRAVGSCKLSTTLKQDLFLVCNKHKPMVLTHATWSYNHPSPHAGGFTSFLLNMIIFYDFQKRPPFALELWDAFGSVRWKSRTSEKHSKWGEAKSANSTHHVLQKQIETYHQLTKAIRCYKPSISVYTVLF